MKYLNLFSNNNCICLQVPENCVFFVNIHEPIIWRLHEMVQHLKIDRISSSQSSAVSVDPVLKIGYVINCILPVFYFPFQFIFLLLVLNLLLQASEYL